MMQPELFAYRRFTLQRRPVPKVVPYLIYSVISVGIIASVIVILTSRQLGNGIFKQVTNRRPLDNQTARKLQKDPRLLDVAYRKLQGDLSHVEDDLQTVSKDEITSLYPDQELFSPVWSYTQKHVYKATEGPSAGQPRPENYDGGLSASIKLKEVIAYECLYEAGIKNYKWVRGSDTEVRFLDAMSKWWIIDLVNNRTSPQVTPSKIDGKKLLERHVSTTWYCNSEMCQFEIRLQSSLDNKKPLKFGTPLILEIAQLAQGRSADFTYIRELNSGSHKRKFSVWLNPFNYGNFTNLCTRSSFEKYLFTWKYNYLTPKYTILVSEVCPTHQLATKDEFKLDEISNISDFMQSYVKDLLLNKYGVLYDKKNLTEVPQSTKNNSRTGASNVSFVNGFSENSNLSFLEHRSVKNDSKADFRDLWKDWIQKAVNFRQCRSLDENDSFEYLRIGETNWVLHTVIKKLESRPSILSLAISKSNDLNKELLAHEPGWIPFADAQTYKIILGDFLYVTKVEGMLIDKNEALIYFIAAPILNFSYRFLYQIKLNYSIKNIDFGPAKCLTCAYGDDDNTTNSLGSHPNCAWSEVQMSHTAKNYILSCKGPEAPWTSVISTRDNTVIHRLDEEQPKFKGDQTQIDFEVDLGFNYRARARLHLPKKCANARLLLGLGNRQMVSARFDLSIVDYLTSVKGYAVLHADVRGSRFQSLDLSKVRFRRLQMMQVKDYLRVARYASKLAQDCINSNYGYGVFGESYSAQVVMGLIANGFRCGIAIRPFVPWQFYSGTLNLADRASAKIRKRRHLLDLMRRLRDKKFALFDANPEPDQSRRQHINLLRKLASRLRMRNFTYRSFAKDNCGWKLKLYREMSDYFDDCFESL